MTKSPLLGLLATGIRSTSDPVATRRSAFGRIIVHGIHTLLWALDTQVSEPASICTLTATFPKPAYVGELVELTVEQGADSTIELVATSGPNQVLKASVEYQPDDGQALVLDAAWQKAEPDVLDAAELVDVSGEMPLQIETALGQELFPNLSVHLNATDLALLLSTSRIVGMSCPGMYSLFSSLTVGVGKESSESEGSVRFQLTDFDDRFARCTITASAAQTDAKILAFLRPRPTEQASIAEVASMVDQQRFDGTRALIIGGSRGLGEVAAKILAAGGADVAVTYHQGRDDAAALVHEIAGAGGKATAVQLDVTDESTPLPMPFDGPPTAILYFATPPIFVGSRTTESPELLEHFLSFYRTAFERVVESYHAAGTECFYAPSSVAVTDPPPDMREYAEAKRQQEEWCFAFADAAGIRIATPRLPRVATDQTASNMPVDNADGLELMLTELEELIGPD